MTGRLGDDTDLDVIIEDPFVHVPPFRPEPELSVIRELCLCIIERL